MNVRLHIVHQSTRTTIVKPWGFDMEVSYEYEPGEPAIWSPIDRAHPGSPANASLVSATVGGVDITDMLDTSQREYIEETILEQLEE